MNGRPWVSRDRQSWEFLFFGILIATSIVGQSVAADSANTTTARQLVDEALQSEVTGEAGRRTVLLREAIYFDPDCEAARWHLGQIQAGDQWQNVGEAQQAAANDPVLAEYRQLREQCGDAVEGQLALARWCRRNSLEQEAQVHWSNVLAVNPANEEAQRALGMRWFDGRLLTYAQIDGIKAKRRAATDAKERWASQIAKWNRRLSGSGSAASEAALREIRALTDPDAIPALEGETLGDRAANEREIDRRRQMSLAVVDALVGMAAHAATQSLVRHAVLSEISEARQAAIAGLKKLPWHDYVPMLLDGLAMPLESSFRVVTSADGSVHYSHSLYREGSDADWSVDTRLSAMQQNLGGRRYTWDVATKTLEVGPPTESEATLATRKAQVAARYQNHFGSAAAATERQVGVANQFTEATNARIIAVLNRATGQNLGDNPKAWWDWWRNQNEYYSSEDHPVDRHYNSDTDFFYYGYSTYDVRYPPPPPLPPGRYSCFAKGTSVWTKTGQQPIESLKIGDLVLAKNPDTGELAYKPIMGTTIRPPCSMLRLTVGKEVLTTTLGHPMWVSGTAWQMAKELKAGAILHGVEGPMTVGKIDPADEAEAYNLIVADFNTYFVGEQGILVHDNTPRQPTLAKVPGLAAAD